jgi:HAD superfamily hydrolase (TIGR01509 family)
LSANRSIRAVIFDLGNVLIDVDHKISARRISRFTDKTPQEIFDFFFDSELTGLFEEGKISGEDFFLKIKETLKAEIGYAEFLPIWNEIFFLHEDNRAVYNLAKDLKNQYRLALLSNTNILHFDYLKKNFPIFDPFDHLIVSFEVGFRKPHHRIYHQALELLGVMPEETFYTDDRRELIQAANSLGISGFVFEGAKRLEKDLRDSGIKKR